LPHLLRCVIPIAPCGHEKRHASRSAASFCWPAPPGAGASGAAPLLRCRRESNTLVLEPSCLAAAALCGQGGRGDWKFQKMAANVGSRVEVVGSWSAGLGLRALQLVAFVQGLTPMLWVSPTQNATVAGGSCHLPSPYLWGMAFCIHGHGSVSTNAGTQFIIYLLLVCARARAERKLRARAWSRAGAGCGRFLAQARPCLGTATPCDRCLLAQWSRT